MLHISLFSGIGGFDLAAEWMGWKNIVSCEINDFGNKVLEYYWPNAYHHRDIHTLNYQLINDELTKRYGQEWRSNDIILTGGFPCQPYSVAGKRLGKEDERHLWPEMLRVISEVKPTFVVGENVSGLLSWNGGLVFDEVRADLETQGYEVAVYVLPAAGVNAPHKRERVWFVAYANGRNHQARCQRYGSICENYSKQGQSINAFSLGEIKPFTANCDHSRLERGKISRGAGGSEQKQQKQPSGLFRGNWKDFPTQSAVCSRNDGIPLRLDTITFSKWRNETIKAGGNAIVPQVAFEIFKAIEKTHYSHF